MCHSEECLAVECMQCHGCLAVAALAILPSRTDAVHHREHAEKCIFEHCSHPAAIIFRIPSSFQRPCAFPALPCTLVAAFFLDGFTGFQFSLYLTTDLLVYLYTVSYTGPTPDNRPHDGIIPSLQLHHTHPTNGID